MFVYILTSFYCLKCSQMSLFYLGYLSILKSNALLVCKTSASDYIPFLIRGWFKHSSLSRMSPELTRILAQIFQWLFSPIANLLAIEGKVGFCYLWGASPLWTGHQRYVFLFEPAVLTFLHLEIRKQVFLQENGKWEVWINFSLQFSLVGKEIFISLQVHS